MNRRMSPNRWLVAALFVAAVLAMSCGRKQSVASRSAAAFQEAQRKGLPTGEDSHGGHAGVSGESPTATVDHSTMTGMDHSKMAGMDHSKMAGMGQSKMAGMDHSKMPGMDPSKMDKSAMAGMQHGQMTPAQMQQGGMAPHAAASPAIDVNSAQARPGQPAATLSADPIDAPAPTSVMDASRSAEMSQMMASGGHGMAHGVYVQQDVGRDSSPRDGSASMMQHEGHAMPGMQQGTPGGITATEGAKAATVVYTCPMHPEVRSERPGQCPKCGMTLVKKEKK